MTQRLFSVSVVRCVRKLLHPKLTSANRLGKDYFFFFIYCKYNKMWKRRRKKKVLERGRMKKTWNNPKERKKWLKTLKNKASWSQQMRGLFQKILIVSTAAVCIVLFVVKLKKKKRWKKEEKKGWGKKKKKSLEKNMKIETSSLTKLGGGGGEILKCAGVWLGSIIFFFNGGGMCWVFLFFSPRIVVWVHQY